LQKTLDFAMYLAETNKKIWLRHVLVPGITDEDELLIKLADFLKNELKNIVERVEVLPYHTMGVFKYENLKIPYPLAGVKPPTKERVANARNIFRSRGFKVW
ncbi:MAG: pyruvate formate lyase 1-activating protein, partial [Spirochaetota bacterium]